MFTVRFKTSERSIAETFRQYVDGPVVESLSNTSIRVQGTLTSQSHSDTFMIVLAPFISQGKVRNLTIVPEQR